MKRAKTISGASLRGAIQGGTIFFVLQLVHDKGSFVDVPTRTAIGLAVGALIGPLGWLIGKQFKEKERETIEQSNPG